MYRSIVSLSLGKAGSYCNTKGRISLRTFFFRFSITSDFLLSENLTSERCFSAVLAGQSLFLRRIAIPHISYRKGHSSNS